ncbi:MAG: protein translocase subunit SecF [Blastochloris viridis]|uniref:Protein-export membrane protein SecF n=1 Tax=Blastochloris viridis TaxID=1079 RepID=A0A6N4REG8_BLAVI|nr:MAG: protein translocase subunit SecF [Blastochloris viridis]
MRFPIRPFDKVPHFDFMHLRAFWLWSSAAMVAATFVLLAVIGLNYGIDFVGGKMVEAKLAKPISVAEVRAVTDEAGFEGSVIQQYGAEDVYLIRLPGNIPATQTAAAENSVMAGLSKIAGGAELRRVEFVGPQVGEELRMKGLMAMLMSIAAILVYVWARFELRYGLGAILALSHDVILTIGIVAVMKTEITLTSLAAILTLIGYSLNETIVIFDRVRDNRRKYPNRPLREVINLSVNQTLGRTIMTGGSVFLVLWCLFLWGGEAVHDFSRILIIGVALGTYSSIFVSSSALLALEEWYRKMARDAAESNKVETKSAKKS